MSVFQSASSSGCLRHLRTELEETVSGVVLSPVAVTSCCSMENRRCRMSRACDTCGTGGTGCAPAADLKTLRLGLCVPAKCLAASTMPVHAAASTYGCLSPNECTSSSVRCDRVILCC